MATLQVLHVDKSLCHCLYNQCHLKRADAYEKKCYCFSPPLSGTLLDTTAFASV